jgi:hypothetical protein
MIQKIDSALGRFIYSQTDGTDRACVWQHPARAGVGPVHLTGKGEGQHPVETLQHGAQSVEDLPVWMDHSDGAERIESDGGIEKTLSTLSTRKDDNRMEGGTGNYAERELD